VPPALALMHQAMAMAILTLTVIHVSEVMPQDAHRRNRGGDDELRSSGYKTASGAPGT